MEQLVWDRYIYDMHIPEVSDWMEYFIWDSLRPWIWSCGPGACGCSSISWHSSPPYWRQCGRRRQRDPGSWRADEGKRVRKATAISLSNSFQREVNGSPADSWTPPTGSGRWSCRCWQRGAPENKWLKPGRERHLRSSGPSCRIWITWGRTQGEITERLSRQFLCNHWSENGAWW